jgi:hypothetical protein
MELDAPYCDVIRQRWAEFVHGEGCNWKKLTPAVKARFGFAILCAPGPP